MTQAAPAINLRRGICAAASRRSSGGSNRSWPTRASLSSARVRWATKSSKTWRCSESATLPSPTWTRSKRAISADRCCFGCQMKGDSRRMLPPPARAIFIRPFAPTRLANGNVLADIGLGWFRWANVVVGALDNREARLFVNSASCRVGRPWIDGGIDILTGIVRGFFAPATACYECTMGEADWTLLNQRRSCSILARLPRQENASTPTTPTTASVIGRAATGAGSGEGIAWDGSIARQGRRLRWRGA